MISVTNKWFKATGFRPKHTNYQQMKKSWFYSVALLAGMILTAGIPVHADVTADAVFERVSKKYVLLEDGSVEFRHRKEVKLLTHYAFHRLYGETFIVYNPGFQTLTINEAYTVMADGKEIITPKNAFNEVLPRMAENAAFANGLREMVVTHTGLEVGATIVLDYSIVSRRGLIPFFMGGEILAEHSPVKDLEFIIEVPEKTTLNFRLYHAKGASDLRREGGLKTYTWRFRDLPAIHSEVMQADAAAYAPCLCFSTSAALHQVLAAFMLQQAFPHPADDQIKQFVDRVNDPALSPLQKALNLQEKIITEFRLFRIPLPLLDYQVRPSWEVFRSAGGTDIEKALLLMAFLELAGIPSELVAQFPAYFDQGMGNLSIISQYCVLANIPGDDPVLLSVREANDQDLLYTHPGGAWVSLNPKAGLQPLLLKDPGASISMEGRFELFADHSIEGSFSLSAGGKLNPRLAMSLKPKAAIKGIKGFVTSSDMKDITTIRLTPHSSETRALTGSRKTPALKGELLVIEWPYHEKGMASWSPEEFLSERESPVFQPLDLTESCNYTLTIPDGSTLVNPVERIVVANQAGKVVIECKQKGNKVFFSKEITLKQQVYSENQESTWNGLRRLVSLWHSPHHMQSLIRP